MDGGKGCPDSAVIQLKGLALRGRMIVHVHRKLAAGLEHSDDLRRGLLEIIDVINGIHR